MPDGSFAPGGESEEVWPKPVVSRSVLKRCFSSSNRQVAEFRCRTTAAAAAGAKNSLCRLSGAFRQAVFAR